MGIRDDIRAKASELSRDAEQAWKATNASRDAATWKVPSPAERRRERARAKRHELWRVGSWVPQDFGTNFARSSVDDAESAQIEAICRRVEARRRRYIAVHIAFIPLGICLTLLAFWWSWRGALFLVAPVAIGIPILAIPNVRYFRSGLLPAERGWYVYVAENAVFVRSPGVTVSVPKAAFQMSRLVIDDQFDEDPGVAEAVYLSVAGANTVLPVPFDAEGFGSLISWLDERCLVERQIVEI